MPKDQGKVKWVRAGKPSTKGLVQVRGTKSKHNIQSPPKNPENNKENRNTQVKKLTDYLLKFHSSVA